MGVLTELFHDVLAEVTRTEKIGAQSIARRLAKRDITLTEDQVTEIESRIAKSEVQDGGFDIDIGDLLPAGSDQSDFLIDDDTEEVEEYIQELCEKLDSAVPTIIEETAVALLERLTIAAPEMLEARRKQQEEFEQRLVEKWGLGFTSLETLIAASAEAGQTFNEECRAQAAKEQDLVFDVLTRLHARSCQVAQEVLVLLRSGLADGAHARWRTLHEIAVTAMFVSDNDNSVAERYLLHHHVESYKAALQVSKHYSKLGVANVFSGELDALKATRDELVARFGDEYKNSYGWASSALGKAKPNFSDIEETISLDHLRPYYKLASHNVHANSKGVTFRLGLLNSGPIVLLAGPSNEGLADPGSSTALSLAQVTVTMLTSRADLDKIVLAKVVMTLAKGCQDSFMEAHRKLIDEAV